MEFTNGRNHSRSAAAEGFLQRAGAHRRNKLIYAEEPLFHRNAPFLEQSDAALARDARQHRAGELRCHDRARDLEHHVHAAHFFNILAFHAIQPQHLGEAELFRPCTRAVCRRVVAAALGIARAAAHRTHILGFDHDADGIDAFFIIAAHRRSDDAEHRMGNAVQRKVGIRREQERADIKRSTGRIGHPVLIQLHKLAHGFKDEFLIELRQRDTLRRIAHALQVFHRPEHLNFAFCRAVCLQALKHLRAIMEHSRCRRKRNG